MSSISKEQALRLLEGSSKRAHSITTSRIMVGLARRLGEDENEWELVGLLHDLDYDMVRSDMSKHGIPCERIDASDFDLKKGASFMLILGGQLAYDGVGNISQQVLPQSIQRELVENQQAHRRYSGFNLWAGSQQVIVLAGHDRYLTEKAVEEAFRSA